MPNFGFRHSEESRIKMGLSRRGKKQSEETKRKISLAHMGKKHPRTPEWSKKIADALRGKKRSKEAIEKTRRSLVGHVVSIETRKKISEDRKRKKIRPWNAGKTGVYSKETLKKMIDSRRGYRITEETKLKLSLAHRGIKNAFWGKKHSEKDLIKMREFKVAHPNKNFKDTSIEVKMETELRKRGIAYKKQFPLCGVAVVDFYLPEFRLVIQCDGCFYHNCPVHYPKYHLHSHPRSEKQDAILSINGLKVYRFWEHDINKSVKTCVDLTGL